MPEEDLPVELPYDVDFTPDGTSPLAKHEGFMNVKCPVCGADARRDPDTMDTFMCSSWYYLRYPDNKDDKMAWDPAIINKMLPVDKYIGGAEHACMHLLYSRFFTKAFRDMGYLNFDEPFASLVHQGVILGPDGERMSKSRGNVISPDEYVNKYGADAFRMYLGFGFSYVEGGPWNDGGIKAIYKYMERVERLVERIQNAADDHDAMGEEEKKVNFVLHNTIKSVTADLDEFLLQHGHCPPDGADQRPLPLYRRPHQQDICPQVPSKTMMKLMAPFAPHFAEELWERLGGEYSIFNQSFPEYDESALAQEEVTYPLQVNGKVRERFSVPADLDKAGIEAYVREHFASYWEGKQLLKLIVVPGRIVNVVVK